MKTYLYWYSLKVTAFLVYCNLVAISNEYSFMANFFNFYGH